LFANFYAKDVVKNGPSGEDFTETFVCQPTNIVGYQNSLFRNYKDASTFLKALDEQFNRRNKNAWRASEKGCFRAVLAIRCAYRFVPSELSWEYFHATSSLGQVLSNFGEFVDVDVGPYDSRCMRIAFII
jgi:hypothetical protein